MNVFLPYEKFRPSIESLDKKRAWKQCVEADQILNALEGKSKGWVHHPATLMFKNNINSLKEYYNICLDHCVKFWGIKAKKLQPRTISGIVEHPKWLGYPKFHSLMRANLVRKNPEWYKFEESPQEGYFWPCDSNGEIKEEIKQWIAIHHGATTTFGIHSK